MKPDRAKEVASVAIANCSKLTGPESRSAIASLAKSESEVNQAVSELATSDPLAALSLIGAMRDYWVLAGRQASTLELVTKVVEATAGAVPTRDRAAALVCAGTLAFFSGENDRAAAYHDEALALATAIGNQGIAADALVGLARVAMQRNDYVEMRSKAQASGAIARSLGDDDRLAVAIHHDAVGADLQGLAEGSDLHLETLAIQRRLGNQRGIALELLNLGLVALNRGEVAVAIERLREAFAIFSQLGVTRNVALSLALLGVAASDERDPELAARLLGKAVSMKRALRTTFTVGAERHIDRVLANCQRELGEDRLRELLLQGEESPEQELAALTLSREMHDDDRAQHVHTGDRVADQ